MAKRPPATAVNTPTPLNLQSGAAEVGCSLSWYRSRIRKGELDAARTPSGHIILYPHHIDSAKRLYAERTNKRSG